jgi:hypothetical protein
MTDHSMVCIVLLAAARLMSAARPHLAGVA